MKLPYILIMVASMLTPIGAAAQASDETFDEYRERMRKEFGDYRTRKQTEFEQYRARLNAEYAKMIESSWQSFKPEKQDAPKIPEPVDPRFADNDAAAPAGDLKIGKVVAPAPKIPDVPVTLPKVPKEKVTYPINFTFYNTPCGLHNFDTSKGVVTAPNNAAIGKAWTNLTADGGLDQLVDDCLRLREEMQLCDWGYVKLVDKVGETLYPKSLDSRAVLATALLNLSGYDARVGMKGGKVVMLYYPNTLVYVTHGIIVDGKRYYLYGPAPDGVISTYQGTYRQDATPIRLDMDRVPRFAVKPGAARRYSSAGWREAPRVELSVNPSAIEFYKDYPIVDWSVYGATPLSREVQSTLVPALEMITEGMDEVEAVNTLIRYVSHGFEYMTDDDQFGYEKAFFPDELFYYPYSDCEDRAILFSKLVNKLLGLDVVYLHYPNHLAAAVRFSPGTKISGTSVNVDGQKYYVCDPTWKSGAAGKLAAQFANSTPEVHKVKQ